MIQVLWPDRYWITEDKLKIIACDALANEESTRVNPEDLDLCEAIEIVNHWGYLTTGKQK